jgi:tRNA1(Val) A37 N6-methylase TrmN6
VAFAVSDQSRNEPDGGVTDDAFLGDGLRILQPRRGYRAGVDAVLLAATVVPHDAVQRVMDAGAGVGVVGLSVAQRCPGTRTVLLEREAALVSLAEQNITRNHLMGRVRAIRADLLAVSAPELQAQGVEAESFDHVLANPPFHCAGEGTPSASSLKEAAHAMEAGGLERWARFLARMTRAGGFSTVIHRAEALGEVLEVLEPRFGSLRILPVHARGGEPAIRVIVRGVKGSKAPSGLLPGFVLHGEGGAFTAEAEAILRHGGGLPLLESTA